MDVSPIGKRLMAAWRKYARESVSSASVISDGRIIGVPLSNVKSSPPVMSHEEKA